MQVKKIGYKALFVLCLTVTIGISSTACNKALKQGIPENTEIINEESSVTVNNSVKDNKVAVSNKASESSSSVEKKTSTASGKTQNSAAQLNTTPQPSPKAITVPSSDSGTKSGVQLNGETAYAQDASQEDNPSSDPIIEPALTSEPQTSAEPEPEQPTPVPPAISSTGNKIINYAINFLGVRYLWGGTSPVDTNPDPNIDNSGFSDTGFVQYVFAHFDIAVGLNRSEQIKVGTEVSKEELQVGDIVFFGSNISYPVHVGIYVGNNTYIHSPNTGDVVKISPFTRNDFITARRVIK
jgi:cell wall-associated NlpC family hydrolase